MNWLKVDVSVVFESFCVFYVNGKVLMDVEFVDVKVKL